MRSVTLTPYQSVERYVKALQDITFTIPSDVIEKLSSPLKNHPRITSVNPPLTVQELEAIAMREIDKVYDEKTFVTYNSTIQKRVKAILTDKQTILFSVVGNAQKRAIADANRELYKDIKKRLAESETKFSNITNSKKRASIKLHTSTSLKRETKHKKRQSVCLRQRECSNLPGQVLPRRRTSSSIQLLTRIT